MATTEATVPTAACCQRAGRNRLLPATATIICEFRTSSAMGPMIHATHFNTRFNRTAQLRRHE